MSAIAMEDGRFAIMLRCVAWVMMESGRGLTRLGRGSIFLYADSWRCKRKSSLPFGNSLGSSWPSEGNVWPMARKVPSTVRLQTGALEGAMSPTLYRRAKSCSNGIGSAFI